MPTLVDSGVWIDHLHREETRLVSALHVGDIVTHPVVIGELACGSIRKRAIFLDQLRRLPRVPAPSFEAALALIESFHLHGRGLGWSDAQLLASALDAGVKLWTRDKPLLRAARDCGVAILTERPA